MASTHSRRAPYGTWKSPVSADSVAGQSRNGGIEEVILDPVTSKVYYAQKRPAEGGRSVIVDASDGSDIFDGSWDARSRVHEYGGGAASAYNDVIYFSFFKDLRVYRVVKGSEPSPVTPVVPARRYADFATHPIHEHLLVAICEDHTDPHPTKVQTYLVIINTRETAVTKLVDGADFYACPRFSPDGTFLIWQQWNLPDMPFHSSVLMLASISVVEDNPLQIGSAVHIAGEVNKFCAQDPIWTSNSTLFFHCDISGYQNPWTFTIPEQGPTHGVLKPVHPTPAEEEYGAPQWLLSRHCSGALSSKDIVTLSFREGRSTLHLFNLDSGTHQIIPTPFAHIQFMRGDGKSKVAFLGQPADSGDHLMELTLVDGKPQLHHLVAPNPSAALLKPDQVSVCQYHRLNLGTDNRVCHVNLYLPKNSEYDSGLEGERPPVLVWIHGGPYFMETSNFDLSKQFWTTRGWARLEVNYGGSTGFGVAYRESLNDRWGILDIKDAWESALQLGSLGLVDPSRAVIAGQSAGGYSVLQAATTLSSLFPTSNSSSTGKEELFRAGIPRYGVSDMRKMQMMMHKFELGILDRAIGKWEDNKEIWHARSPIFHVDKITMPMLFLQGEVDTVVPVEQMKNMVDVLQSKGVKAEIIVFEGEGHGWRKAATIKRVLEKELAFVGEIFGLKNDT